MWIGVHPLVLVVSQRETTIAVLETECFCLLLLQPPAAGPDKWSRDTAAAVDTCKRMYEWE